MLFCYHSYEVTLIEKQVSGLESPYTEVQNVCSIKVALMSALKALLTFRVTSSNLSSAKSATHLLHDIYYEHLTIFPFD